MEQNKFSLLKALQHAEVFPFQIPEYNMELYKKDIYQFVHSL